MANGESVAHMTNGSNGAEGIKLTAAQILDDPAVKAFALVILTVDVFLQKFVIYSICFYGQLDGFFRLTNSQVTTLP